MSTMSLAYLGLGVADAAAWRRFAVDGLGLMDGGERNGAHRLRMDDRSWRIALHETGEQDILYAGLEVGDAVALDALAGSLQSAGLKPEPMSAGDAAERGVAAGLVVHDPDGVRIELIHGDEPAAAPFQSDLVSGFVTGDAGLGHIVLCSQDPEQALRFYQAIGFAVSDFIDLKVSPEMTVRLAFLHCNQRHHTVALAPPLGPRHLDHLMLEVKTVDEVVDSYNRLVTQGVPVKRHLGRHPNDRMFSFYVQTPGGFDLELGFDGVSITEGWTVETYDQISTWGHQAALTPA